MGHRSQAARAPAREVGRWSTQIEIQRLPLAPRLHHALSGKRRAVVRSASWQGMVTACTAGQARRWRSVLLPVAVAVRGDGGGLGRFNELQPRGLPEQAGETVY